jgi:hypothetical protein
MTLESLIGCLSNTWQAKFYSSGDYFGCLVVVGMLSFVEQWSMKCGVLLLIFVRGVLSYMVL